MKTRPSAIILLAANSLPLFGVLLFDWSVFDIVFLYWIENVVIGIFNVVRMFSCRPDPDEFSRAGAVLLGKTGALSTLFFVGFFSVHYGMFCWGHQQFIISLFSDGRSIYEVMREPVLWLALAAIAGSHLYSLFANFFGTGEFRRTYPALLMARPYGRIVVLHVTILVGGFLITLAGSHVTMLLVLIAVKTLIDYRQHDRERELFLKAPAKRLW